MSAATGGGGGTAGRHSTVGGKKRPASSPLRPVRVSSKPAVPPRSRSSAALAKTMDEITPKNRSAQSRLIHKAKLKDKGVVSRDRTKLGQKLQVATRTMKKEKWAAIFEEAIDDERTFAYFLKQKVLKGSDKTTYHRKLAAHKKLLAEKSLGCGPSDSDADDDDDVRACVQPSTR